MNQRPNFQQQFLQKVRDYIIQHRLLSVGERYLVAFSGGADSVSLLLILKQLGYSVEAVHCNFRLRDDESDRDEQFCVELCQHMGVKLHRIHFDTKSYADLHKVSIELAARELRYRYFEQLRQDIGANGICVAHHQDDHVETILMNLVRGTGLQGLTGIHPKNGYVLRPLLCVDREEIEIFLSLQDDIVTGNLGQRYIIDSTNQQMDATRNKFRHQILPLLRNINPSVTQNITQMSELLSDVAKVYDVAMKENMDRSRTDRGYSVKNIMAGSSPEGTLYAILSGYGFTANQVRNIFPHLLSDSGKLWESRSHLLTIDRGELLIADKGEECFSDQKMMMLIPEPGTYVFSTKQKFCFTVKPRENDFMPSRERTFVTLDADMVKWPFSVRYVQNGERFVPFGMNGSRLVSDYLTDRKCSLFDKRRQLVVTDANGEIVWLVGERTDNRFRVTETTETILIISYGANETC